MKRIATWIALVSLATVGCTVETAQQTAAPDEAVEASAPEPAAAAPSTEEPSPTLPGGLADLPGLVGGDEPPATPPAEAAATAAAADDGGLPPALVPAGQAPPAETTRVKAEAGVGKKGQSLENEKGVGRMIAQPARTLFAFEQRAVFEIQIPSAMKLFKATNGRNPNSHDEFMSQIIKANRIQLPKLPTGQRYVYDPQQGELMVEKPAN